jgi:hypothetical protein
MDHRLLTAAAALAALTLPAAPAVADHWGGMHRQGSPRFVDGSASARAFNGCRDGVRDRRDGRRDRRFSCDNFGNAFIYDDGQWALYNNRSWEPDSYNDWWNDRPDRAYPRWVQEQRRRGTCDPDRMWWSGSGWHC